MHSAAARPPAIRAERSAQALHQRVDADVGADANAVRHAEEDQPREQVGDQLERPDEAVVEDVARDHLGEGDHRHDGEEEGDQPFLQPLEV